MWRVELGEVPAGKNRSHSNINKAFSGLNDDYLERNISQQLHRSLVLFRNPRDPTEYCCTNIIGYILSKRCMRWDGLRAYPKSQCATRLPTKKIVLIQRARSTQQPHSEAAVVGTKPR